MSGLRILNRQKLILFILLAAVLFCATACTEMKGVKNQRVGELIDKISQMEYVYDVKASNMAFDLIINMKFKSGFTEEDSLEIMELAIYYLDADTVDALSIEFGQDEPPDTHIDIRDDTGSIVYSFRGSCYESYSRSVPPAYDEYRWS